MYTHTNTYKGIQEHLYKYRNRILCAWVWIWIWNWVWVWVWTYFIFFFFFFYSSLLFILYSLFKLYIVKCKVWDEVYEKARDWGCTKYGWLLPTVAKLQSVEISRSRRSRKKKKRKRRRGKLKLSIWVFGFDCCFLCIVSPVCDYNVSGMCLCVWCFWQSFPIPIFIFYFIFRCEDLPSSCPFPSLSPPPPPYHTHQSAL